MVNKSEIVNGRIKSFDGLRFIIVIFLILHHFDTFNSLNLPGWYNIYDYFYEGYLSVNFFFVLSGFVVQYGYSDKIKNSIVSSKQFLLSRLAHLWPLYLLCLFLATLFYTGKDFFQQFHYPHFWIHLSMLQSFIVENTYGFNYNGLAWSVSNEMFFYIAFVFLVGISEKKRNYLTLGLWIVIVLNVIIVGSITPVSNWTFYINPLFRLADFLTGMWLYDLYKKKIFEPETTKGATNMEVISILILVCSVVIAATTEIRWEYKAQLYYTIPVAILIYTFSFDRGIISKFLGCKLFSFLGSLAFPMYLNHQIILSQIYRYGYQYITTTERALAAGGIAMLASAIIAVPMWYLFSKPINKKLRSYIEKM